MKEENQENKKGTQYTHLLKPSEKQQVDIVKIKKITIPTLEDLNKYTIYKAYDNFLNSMKEQEEEKLRDVKEKNPDFNEIDFELTPIIIGLLQSAYKRTIKRLYKLTFIDELCKTKSITKINKPILNHISIELFHKSLNNNEITILLKKYNELYEPAKRNLTVELEIDEKYLKEIKSKFHSSIYFDDERIRKIYNQVSKELNENDKLDLSKLEFTL